MTCLQFYSVIKKWQNQNLNSSFLKSLFFLPWYSAFPAFSRWYIWTSILNFNRAEDRPEVSRTPWIKWPHTECWDYGHYFADVWEESQGDHDELAHRAGSHLQWSIVWPHWQNPAQNWATLQSLCFNIVDRSAFQGEGGLAVSAHLNLMFRTADLLK